MHLLKAVLAALALVVVALAGQTSEKFNSVSVSPDNSTVVPGEATVVAPVTNNVVSSNDAITIPQMMSYQGRLTDASGVPVADALYAVRFRLYAEATGGTPFWEEEQEVRTRDGLFSVLLGSVTPIGAVPDAGAAYLGMSVESSAEMTPRLRITGTYASPREGVGTSYVPPGGTDGCDYWVLGSDFVLWTAHRYGLSKGDAGNKLHGDYSYTQNNLGSACTTGASGWNYANSTVGGGYRNRSSNNYTTVSGGYRNTASENSATIGGGYGNTASGYSATVGGGYSNIASGYAAAVGGGYKSTASASYTTVGGGYYNTARGYSATVGGGYVDTAKGYYSGVFSGYSNLAGDAAGDTGAGVACGIDNAAMAKYTFVGGGWHNTASGRYATVGGGMSNTTSFGSGDTAGGSYATVGGGSDNTANGRYATVSGGDNNTASGDHAAVAGGSDCDVAANYGFAVGNNSYVSSGHINSAAFNGTTTTSSGQLRCGTLSQSGGGLTIDHPLDPSGRILNHYFVESPDMCNVYSGSVVLDAAGRGEVRLPEYFDALNRSPRVQLTGVGSADVVYVAEKVSGNRFAVGGKPGMEVYWQVTGERKDPPAEIARLIMPVEQPKTGELAGHSLDDDFLRNTKDQLDRMGAGGQFGFRTAAGREKYEKMKRAEERR